MLEALSLADLQEWRDQELFSMEALDLRKTTPGTIVRVLTLGGNCYFFEVVDPTVPTVCVVRWEARCEGRLPAGYRDVWGVHPPVIRKGRTIWFEMARTSAVTEITVID